MLHFMYLIVFVGKVLCSGSADGTMRIWNPKTGESIHRVAGQKKKKIFFSLFTILYCHNKCLSIFPSPKFGQFRLAPLRVSGSHLKTILFFLHPAAVRIRNKIISL
jgi:WD40 repeat protein